MAILNRLRASRWVMTLLSLMFALILVLSWTTAANAQANTPFDVQYTLLGIQNDPGDPGDPGQNSGNSGLSPQTSNVAGQGVGSALQGLQGLLPSTGGPQLGLVILGSSALCFGSALLMQHVRNRRR